MRRIWVVAAAIVGLGAIGAAAAEPSGRPGTERPSTPAEPPASGTSSSELGRSGGVITPPLDVDPEMKRTPPPSGAKMPVIPPPGTPGGDPSITPK